MKYSFLNCFKISWTSFNQSNSRGSEKWKHNNLITKRGSKNNWLRVQLSCKNRPQITNLALCCLRIFHILLYWFKGGYLEFWNFYQLIRRLRRTNLCSLSFSTQQSGSISNCKKPSKFSKVFVKTSCLEETTRGQI